MRDKVKMDGDWRRVASVCSYTALRKIRWYGGLNVKRFGKEDETILVYATIGTDELHAPGTYCI